MLDTAISITLALIGLCLLAILFFPKKQIKEDTTAEYDLTPYDEDFYRL